MKLVDIESKIDKRQYGVNSLIDDIMGLHKEDGIELMAIIYKKKDGSFGIGTTYGNNAEILGLLELGKMQYLEDF